MRLISVFLFILPVLASCGGSSNSATNPPPLPPPPPEPEFLLDDLFQDIPNFDRPLATIQAPGDPTRWFVVEQAGTIRVFQNESTANTVDTFLDISGRVDSGPREAGLLGMAFHPNFSANGEVFVSYTETGTPLTSVVSRFTSSDSGLTLDSSSEEVILRFDQEDTNHNGGQIGFGPDGYLYIGSGDGGGSGDPFDRGEDPTNLLGAILRIDIDGSTPYAIPSSNPFFGNALCVQDHSSLTNCPEIFAWGFRNPWRWSFDSQNGQLWLGDVGQGDWEEVDIVEVGRDYGWNHREGAHCFEPAVGCETVGLVDPVAEYARSEGQSITGGYVYRGTDIPFLVGAYVFGDFASGALWTLTSNNSGGFDRQLMMNTGLSIASFAEANDGELYIVDLGGRIFKILPE